MLDWQEITEWVGDPLLSVNAQTVPAGTTRLGSDLPIGNYQAVIVYVVTTLANVDIVVTHRPESAPPAVLANDTLGFQGGIASMQTLAIFGDTIAGIDVVAPVGGAVVSVVVMPANTLAQFTPPGVGDMLFSGVALSVAAGGFNAHNFGAYAGWATLVIEYTGADLAYLVNALDCTGTVSQRLIANTPVAVPFTQTFRLSRRRNVLFVSNAGAAAHSYNAYLTATPAPYGG